MNSWFRYFLKTDDIFVNKEKFHTMNWIVLFLLILTAWYIAEQRHNFMMSIYGFWFQTHSKKKKIIWGWDKESPMDWLVFQWCYSFPLPSCFKMYLYCREKFFWLPQELGVWADFHFDSTISASHYKEMCQLTNFVNCLWEYASQTIIINCLKVQLKSYFIVYLIIS